MGCSVLPSELADLQLRMNREFTYDACSTDCGSATTCKAYSCSGLPFTHTDVGGHTVWLAPSVRNLVPYLTHYRACKQLQAATTAACILAPSKADASLFVGMRPIKRYPVGTQLFSATGLQGERVLMPGIPTELVAWYDAPGTAAVPVCSTVGDSTPHVLAHVRGKSVSTLLDSGAGLNYVAQKLVQDLNLRVTAAPFDLVGLADGSGCPVQGQVLIRLKLGPVRMQVRALVLPNLTAAADVIVGSQTMESYKFHLDFERHEVSLQKQSLRYRTQYTVGRAPDPSSEREVHHVVAAMTARAEVGKASRKQAKNMLRKGAHMLMVRPLIRADTVIRAVAERAGMSAPTVSAVGLSEPDPDVAALLARYQDVFAEITGLPPERPVEHTIPLQPDASPVSRPLYRLTPVELEEVKRQVEDLTRKGMIRPSQSPWAAPILFVGKKDGTLRMVVDYRGLNAQTVKNRYPLPRIDELIDSLGGSAVYSSLDLQQGYNQIKIRAEDVSRTAFRTPMGHYEFVVLPFGLTNAPATFQAVMNRIFEPYIGRFVVVYLDDILVFSRNREEHLKHLETCLDVLRKQKFHAKASKCHWAKSELEYLGHIVSAEGVRMDPKKVSVVRDWPLPQSVTELRQFLGLTNYFRKFIRSYAALSAPLTDMLRGDARCRPEDWTPEGRKAFAQVKNALADDVLLRYPDMTQPFAFEVIADASLRGTGAVLLQSGQPIAFTSKKFTPAERNYTTGEQELLGVIHALREWRCYLEGPHDVQIVTDHHPLIYLKTQPTLSRRQARWLEFLSRFHLTWVHRAGKLNVADALSRHPLLTAAAVTTRKSLRARILAGYAKDPWFRDPLNTDQLEHDSHGYWLKTMADGRKRVAVPDVGTLRKELVSRCHGGPLAGHPGKTRTTELVQRAHWWPTLVADVEAFVASCEQCQRNKPRSGKPPGLLQPLPIPDMPWDSVAMDFVTGLPRTKKGYDTVLVFVDRLTKMAHFVPTTKTVTAEQTAELFFENVVRLHGLPKTTVSDRGPQFAGKFWQHLARMVDLRAHLISAFHPQTDGQTERMNRVLGDMLRNYCDTAPTTWDAVLGLAEFATNNAVNRSVGQTPFFLNYGWHPRTPLIRELDLTVPAAKAYAKTLEQRLADAKSCLKAAQDRTAAYYNKTHKDVQFAPQQLVLLSTKNLTLAAGAPRKLQPKWIGPFAVEQMIGSAAVQLNLPERLRFHNVFHVSLVIYPDRTRTGLPSPENRKAPVG